MNLNTENFDRRLRKAVAESNSQKETAKRLGFCYTGRVRRRIIELGLDTSHWHKLKWSDDLLRIAVSESKGVTETARRMGRAPSYVIARRIEKLHIDTSHWVNNTLTLNIGGVSMTSAEAAAVFGFLKPVIVNRIKSGMDPVVAAVSPLAREKAYSDAVSNVIFSRTARAPVRFDGGYVHWECRFCGRYGRVLMARWKNQACVCISRS